MAKFIVTLKQHTPLIHFQWYQDGAILRASEVKPKLDRFLKHYVFKDNFEEYKNYLIGYSSEKTEKDFKEKGAFDYKLRINNVMNLKEEEIEYKNSNKKLENFPNYFGNIGKSNKKINKKSKFRYCDSLDLEFFTLNKNILQILKNNLPQFLMKYNFGQRQSKGFGSFFINDENRYFIDEKVKYYDKEKIKSIKKLKYSFIVNLNNYNKVNKHIEGKSFFYMDIFKVFNEINEVCLKIRSDKNKFEPYIKRYFENKQMLWDKYAILEKYFKQQVPNSYSKYLVKDLLGLSSKEIWRNYDKKIITKKHCSRKKEDVIERYQSPIFFKPIKLNKKYIVYFEGREICKEFLGEEFLIQCNGKGNLILKTPKEFNIDEFLEYVQKNDSKDIVRNRTVK